MPAKPRLKGTVKAKLSLQPDSYAKFKQAIKDLERAARKEVIEQALMAGGSIIHDAAEQKAPGPLAIRTVSGRTLKTKVDPKFAGVVKGNTKLVAIGPDIDHWYFRFFEFGATRHDIKPKNAKALVFEGSAGTIITGFARQTGGVPMRPFLRPAVDGNKDAAVKAMGAVLAHEIKKAVQ
jgi:HK97 gp10 family phage protein